MTPPITDEYQPEERFRAIFENSAISMCSLALDGKILHVNQEGCQITSHNAEEPRERYDREKF